jgi:hypothetical protein
MLADAVAYRIEVPWWAPLLVGVAAAGLVAITVSVILRRNKTNR